MTRLVHWRYYSFSTPSPELAILVHSLEIISARWQGRLDSHASKQTNLAGKYAVQIRRLHEQCKTDPSFRLDVLGYASVLGSKLGSNVSESLSAVTPPVRPVDQSRRLSYRTEYESPAQQLRTQQSVSYQSMNSPGGVVDTGNASIQYNLAPIRNDSASAATHAYSMPHDGNVTLVANNNNNMTVMNDYDLNSISQMFFDQQYIEMDRVINFDDGIFSTTMGYGDMMG